MVAKKKGTGVIPVPRGDASGILERREIRRGVEGIDVEMGRGEESLPAQVDLYKRSGSLILLRWFIAAWQGQAVGSLHRFRTSRSWKLCYEYVLEWMLFEFRWILDCWPSSRETPFVVLLDGGNLPAELASPDCLF